MVGYNPLLATTVVAGDTTERMVLSATVVKKVMVTVGSLGYTCSREEYHTKLSTLKVSNNWYNLLE